MKSYFCFVTLALLTTTSLAHTTAAYDDNFMPQKDFTPNPMFDYGIHPMLALGAGGGLATQLGQSKVFPIKDPITEQLFNYSNQSATQSAFLSDIFLGVEWAFNPMGSLQLGIDYNQTSSYHAKGMLAQGPDLRSESHYKYNYKIEPRQLLLQGKILYTNDQNYHPYLLAGVGESFNYAYAFQTTVPPGLTYTQQFGNQTVHSFSYRLGFGVDFDINPHMRLGIGYNYANFGSANLGSATIAGLPVSRTLTQTSLPVNELMAQISLIN